MSYFKHQETELFYEVKGEGRAVLCIHGYGIDHHYFNDCIEPVLANASQPIKRYYIDLPGMGLSTIPGKVRNGDDIVEVLIAFIYEIIQEESVILVGNSFGGMLSCGIAKKIPNKIEGMILIAPATGRKVRKLPEKLIFMKDDALLNQLTNEQRENFCVFNVNLTEEAWRIYKRDLLPAIIQNNKSDFLKHQLKVDLSYDLYIAFEKQPYNKPVLFITGKQDNCVGYEDAFELAQKFPESTYVVLQAAGHNVNIDQPMQFRQIVSAWLESQLI